MKDLREYTIRKCKFNQIYQKFSNLELTYLNYIESITGLKLENLLVLSKSIFLLAQSDSIKRKDKDEIEIDEILEILRKILGKIIFLVPINEDVQEILNSIFKDDYIDNFKVEIYKDHVKLMFYLNPDLKHVFFPKYKAFFNDIKSFLNKVFSKEIKLEFK
ncbi:MAG: hypothetical protein ACTSVE_02430 [Candidatus Helarchaeota archaeon]